jgi:hypothetical protein
MKKLCTVLSLLCAAAALSAQDGYPAKHYLELGLMVGASNHSGDIAQPHVEFSQSRPAFGLFARYHLNKDFILKGQLNVGQTYGDDKYSKDRAPRQFKVKGPLYELSAVAEFAPLQLGAESTSGSEFYFSPYLFVGVGGVFVNPQVEYYGPPEGIPTYIKTPFPEEGTAQRTLLCTPLGGGLRVNINQRLTLGAEVGWRPVYSDLLDGVSKNGNPDATDWYYFGGITASYYINGDWKREK